MKNTIIILAVAAATLASCSKSESETLVTPAVPDLSAPISLSAGVTATTDTKALSGDSFTANTSNVFSVSGYAGSTTPSNWANTYFSNQQVNSGSSSALTFSTAQYYPANGDKVYFYAYAPSSASITAASGSATVAYTLTGQQDILWAKDASGIAKASTGTQDQPEFQFEHKLMQLKFRVVKDASFEANKTVTKITAKSVKTSATLNIGTGALTFAATTGNLSINPATNNTIAASSGTTLTDYLLLEPTGAGGRITLDIVADGITYSGVDVTLTGTGNGLAGASHLITLTFKRNGITPTAAITRWTSGGAGAADVM